MGACQASDDGSIPFTRTSHQTESGVCMSVYDMVKATITVDRTAYSRKFTKGDEITITLLADGRARIVQDPRIILTPSQFKLLIEESDFDKLLNQEADNV
jgi:hypothetical protein